MLNLLVDGLLVLAFFLIVLAAVRFLISHYRDQPPGASGHPGTSGHWTSRRQTATRVTLKSLEDAQVSGNGIMTVHLVYRRREKMAKWVFVKSVSCANAVQLFDAVMVACIDKRRRARARDWCVQLWPAGELQSMVSIYASGDEIDEFCGKEWQERCPPAS